MRELDPIAMGRRVRQRRKDLGLGQKALARLSGYSQQNISSIEKGIVERPGGLSDLAEALKTTEKWLRYEEGPKAVEPTLTPEEVAKKYEAVSPDIQREIEKLLRSG